jgi:hypothetical protein
VGAAILRGGGAGELFPLVGWVAVPGALRARRASSSSQATVAPAQLVAGASYEGRQAACASLLRRAQAFIRAGAYVQAVGGSVAASLVLGSTRPRVD